MEVEKKEENWFRIVINTLKSFIQPGENIDDDEILKQYPELYNSAKVIEDKGKQYQYGIEREISGKIKKTGTKIPKSQTKPRNLSPISKKELNIEKQETERE